jgi:hypothetical protein
MRNDIEEKHDVVSQHPDTVKHMLDLAEQCRADLGDTTLNRADAGLRAPDGVKE